MKLEVGNTAEVIEITDSAYPILYENGAWGTIENEFHSGACSATVGNTVDTNSTWHLFKDTYRKVGKLTVKSLKHG